MGNCLKLRSSCTHFILCISPLAVGEFTRNVFQYMLFSHFKRISMTDDFEAFLGEVKLVLENHAMFAKGRIKKNKTCVRTPKRIGEALENSRIKGSYKENIVGENERYY